MRGIEIKVARIEAGIKQYEMAAAVGICQARLSNIERGRSRLTQELEARIIHALATKRDTEEKMVED